MTSVDRLWQRRRMSRLVLLFACSFAACTCKPSGLQRVPPPEPEICNGVDDDFDGFVAELRAKGGEVLELGRKDR